RPQLGRNIVVWHENRQYSTKTNNMNVQRNKNWNEQLVTEEIRAWQELGKPLYSHYMRQNYQELLAAGIRYFGTWRAAIEASGIPYDSVRKYRDWSKERITETIQRLQKEG